MPMVMVTIVFVVEQEVLINANIMRKRERTKISQATNQCKTIFSMAKNIVELDFLEVLHSMTYNLFRNLVFAVALKSRLRKNVKRERIHGFAFQESNVHSTEFKLQITVQEVEPSL